MVYIVFMIQSSIIVIMGRTSDEEGESSTKICKSDDIDDRPLKKARYVWQIKGKYHLKKTDEEKHACFPSSHSTNEECSSTVSSCTNTCNNEMNALETNEDSNVHQDAGTSRDHQANSEKPNQNFEVASSEEKCCTPKGHKFESESSYIDKPDWPVPPSPVFHNTHPAWQLRKWQARQVARCFVDNTINRVLEDMGFVPLPVDANDILEEFPMTESENDEGLEDEAVLMAIHRHGLRTEGEKGGTGEESKSDSVKSSSSEVKTSRDIGSAANVPCACSLTSRPVVNAFENLDPFHQRPIFWDQAEIEAQKMLHPPLSNELKNNELIHHWFSDGGLFSSVISSESSCDSDIKSCDENVVEEQASFTNVCAVPCEAEGQKSSPARPEDKVPPEKLKPQDPSSPSFEHTDFLDKAVAVAIQKKGLSKLSCADYS